MGSEREGRTAVSGELVPVELLCENHRRPAQVDAVLVYGLAKGELHNVKDQSALDSYLILTDVRGYDDTCLAVAHHGRTGIQKPILPPRRIKDLEGTR